MILKQCLRKYFIMGSQDCGKRKPENILIEAINSGITIFQYREKGKGSLSEKEQLELGKRLRDICLQHDIPFIVNDNVTLVEPLNADGVHVGQNDTPVSIVRDMFPDKIIGLSISNQAELEQSSLEYVDYVGAGPVFQTMTKPDKTPVGLKWIETLRHQHPELPFVGIGGITSSNATKVLQAGADGVAVISAITKANDIKSVINKL
ncbi:MAG TPA: thiamine phosphate synthase [Cerasibacillus sp.]|uniref:thiamine phosphate synthase n=1 Tax=Cerasibacillus sp. TaxID=2498711 RepID=UPI002F42EF3B